MFVRRMISTGWRKHDKKEQLPLASAPLIMHRYVTRRPLFPPLKN